MFIHGAICSFVWLNVCIPFIFYDFFLLRLLDETELIQDLRSHHVCQFLLWCLWGAECKNANLKMFHAVKYNCFGITLNMACKRLPFLQLLLLQKSKIHLQRQFYLSWKLTGENCLLLHHKRYWSYNWVETNKMQTDGIYNSEKKLNRSLIIVLFCFPFPACHYADEQTWEASKSRLKFYEYVYLCLVKCSVNPQD